MEDKKEIIRKYLERGVLLSPKELENMGTERKITTFSTEMKNKITVQDITSHKNKKYTSIREMISAKIDPISINKIRNFSNASIIGMIKEKTPMGFVVEDTTNELEVVSNNPTEIDDVVGVIGSLREKKFFSQEVVFPDIPLNRNIPSEKGIFMFSHKTTDNLLKNSPDFVFSLDGGNGNNIKIKHNPTRIEIKNKEIINILVYKPPGDISQKEAVTILRKRYIPLKEKQIPLNQDPFLIKIIPDLFWIISDKNWKEYYKGITIFSCNKKSFAIINLETREVEFKGV